MARFKGRIVKIEGDLVTIDRKPETRQIGGQAVGSSWGRGDTPKVGSVVRVNFHKKDLISL